MLQRIVERFPDKKIQNEDEVSNALSVELIAKFQDRDIGPMTIRQLVKSVYPRVPNNLIQVDSGSFTLKTLEECAFGCGLDISSRGIKRRCPPGDKSWKDAQRQLYDEVLCSSFVLKAYSNKSNLRYATFDEFKAEYPELTVEYKETSGYAAEDEKRRKELDKIACVADLDNELFICNAMYLVSKLYANHKKVFKTRCIYLVADIVGDCRGHMGRDPSSNTLRLILYFERLTEIKKRPARPQRSNSDDSSISEDDNSDCDRKSDNDNNSLNKKRKYAKQKHGLLGSRASTGSFGMLAPTNSKLKRSKSTGENVCELSGTDDDYFPSAVTRGIDPEVSSIGILLGHGQHTSGPVSGRQAATVTSSDDATSKGLDLLSSVVLHDFHLTRSERTASSTTQHDPDDSSSLPSPKANISLDSDERCEYILEFTEPLLGIFPDLAESSVPFADSLKSFITKLEKQEDLDAPLLMERVIKVVDDCEQVCSKACEYFSADDQRSIIREDLQRLARDVEMVSRLLLNPFSFHARTSSRCRENSLNSVPSNPDDSQSLSMLQRSSSYGSQDNLLKGTAALHVSDHQPIPLQRSLSASNSSLVGSGRTTLSGSFTNSTISAGSPFAQSEIVPVPEAGYFSKPEDQRARNGAYIRLRVSGLNGAFADLANRIQNYNVTHKSNSEHITAATTTAAQSGSHLALVSARAQRLMERFTTNDIRELESSLKDLRDVTGQVIRAHLLIQQMWRCM